MTQTTLVSHEFFEISLKNYLNEIKNYNSDSYKAWINATSKYLDDVNAFNSNWKEQTNLISTTSVAIAVNIATYYIYVLGGFEITYTGKNSETMVLRSKGYYHYIGA